MIHQKILSNVLSYIDLEYIYFVNSDTVKNEINLVDIENKLLTLFGKKETKRIYYLTVELLQNISRYKDDYFDNNFIFALIKNTNNDDIYLVSGNYSTYEHTIKFTKQIDFLNTLNLKDLNNHYKTCLEKGGYNEKGGAGLGLIEMNRKTEHKLTYYVKKINDDYNFIYNIVRYTLKTDRHIKHKEYSEIIEEVLA